MTKVCILGAGALGSFVAAKLALSADPPTVSVVARGSNLASIRANGITLQDHDGKETAVAKNVIAVESTKEAGVQDVIVLAVKAHQVADVAESMEALYGPDTVIVTMQNGYFDTFDASWGPI